jgi:hypothetical protein
MIGNVDRYFGASSDDPNFVRAILRCDSIDRSVPSYSQDCTCRMKN